jgi:hypothetical protein
MSHERRHWSMRLLDTIAQDHCVSNTECSATCFLNPLQVLKRDALPQDRALKRVNTGLAISERDIDN